MEIFKELYKFYHTTLQSISKTKLFGWIPLDYILHFLLGMILMFSLTKLLKNPVKAFFIILILQISKEILDSFSLTATWQEALIDTALTLSYPLMVLMVIKIKKKLR